ncbi:MAG: putative toxin-antitoxin system toxin component, PIN family [Nitrospirae bacterium]|nr:putative toxin-antitoxin system toxin component, PIN family [Nitrospirota bacterium]
MNKNKRFVIDTNVLISSLLFKDSKPREVVDKILEEGSIIVSVDTIMELVDVLNRPKFDRYLPVNKRINFLASYIKKTIYIEIKERITICRDPKDNKILELSVSGNADCIICGDNDLLILSPFRNIPILTPDEFLKNKY